MGDCCVVLCRDATDDEYVRVTVVAEEDGLIVGQAKVSLAKLRNAVNYLCPYDEGAHIVDMRHPDSTPH
jgi:ribosomal protein S3